MNKEVNTSPIHFISGLPRSGSTLLSAILRQNPKFAAGISSPVYPILQAAHTTMGTQAEGHMQITKEQRMCMQRGIVQNYYEEHFSKGMTVFDTHRQWTSRMPLLSWLFPGSKVICCVRDVAWIIDSFERAIQKDPTLANRMFSPEENQNVILRADTLVDGKRQIGAPWNALKEAYYGQHSQNLLLIELGALTFNPEATIKTLYEFIGEEPFEHDFDNVYYEAEAFDEALGIPGLHKVEGKVEYRQRTTILPPEVFQKYTSHTFWRKDMRTKAKILFIEEDGGK